MGKKITIMLIAVMLLAPTQIFSQKIKFYCSPKKVAKGDTVWLKWNIKGISEKKIKEFVISEYKGDELISEFTKLNDSLMIIAEKHMKYRLYVRTGWRKKNRRLAKLQVYSPIFGIVNIPDSVTPGDLYPLEFACTYTDYVLINDDTTHYSRSESLLLTADTSGVVTLKAFNKNGHFTLHKAAYKVAGRLQFFADTVICLGDPALIIWDIPNAKNIKFSAYPDSIFDNSGRIILFPKHSQNYEFSYEFKKNKLNRKIRIHVLPKGSFWVDMPSKVMSGDIVSIMWNFEENKSVYIKEKAKYYPAKGHMTITAKTNQFISFNFIWEGKKLTLSKLLKVENRKLFAGYREIKDINKHERLVFEMFGSDQSNYPDSVKVFIAVYDLKGYFIKKIVNNNDRDNMVKTYFKGLIEEIDGVRYPINSFTVKEVNKEHESYDFSFALDYSGSMDRDINNLEKSVSEIISTKYPEDRMAFVKFDQQIVNVSPLEKNKDSLLHRLKPTGLDTLGGSTALYAGTYDAMINAESNNQNKKIIIFTDGYENSSAAYWGEKAATGQELVNYSRENDIPLNFIAFGRGTNEELLDLLSWMTNGSYYNLRNSRQITKVFNEIIKISKYYYEITYKPIEKDGQHDLTLLYYDNKSHNETHRSFFVSENYDISAAEDKIAFTNSYTSPIVDSIVKSSGGSAISNSQIVAMFEYDDDNIERFYYQNILNYSIILKKNKSYKALIIGHSDLKGTKRACRIISEKRAAAVQNLLISYGVEAYRLKAIGVGRSSPVWNPELSDTQARENRRVEIVIIK